jgi:hypothetical protein
VQIVVPRIAGEEPPQGGEVMLTAHAEGIIVMKFPALHVDHCECPMAVVTRISSCILTFLAEGAVAAC